MLVISRGKYERVILVINQGQPDEEEISITVLSGDFKVRLGIDAPKHIRIIREELDRK